MATAVPAQAVVQVVLEGFGAGVNLFAALRVSGAVGEDAPVYESALMPNERPLTRGLFFVGAEIGNCLRKRVLSRSDGFYFATTWSGNLFFHFFNRRNQYAVEQQKISITTDG